MRGAAALLLLISTVTATAAGCASPRTPSRPPPESLLTLFARHEKDVRGSGLAMIAVGDAGITFWAATGITIDTPVRVASVTKTFTSTAIMMLRDEGALSLDDRVAKHLPELDASDPQSTIAEVLTHTAGYERSGPWATREPSYQSTEADILQAARTVTLDPGVHRYVYSNIGYALLGLVVGRASHMRYRDYVATKILAPLGMTRSGFETPANAAPASVDGVPAAPIANGEAEASGGMWSTARDLATWVSFQLGAWPAGDRALAADTPNGTPEAASAIPIRRASLRQGHAGRLMYDSAHGAAYGWSNDCMEHLVEHAGLLGGYRSYVAFSPTNRFGLVIVATDEAAPTAVIAHEAAGILRQSRADDVVGKDDTSRGCAL